MCKSFRLFLEPFQLSALDLKLGAPSSWRPVLAVATVQKPASAPARTARSGQSAQQAVPACSVQGCTADLSRCREYHRWHDELVW